MTHSCSSTTLFSPQTKKKGLLIPWQLCRLTLLDSSQIDNPSQIFLCSYPRSFLPIFLFLSLMLLLAARRREMTLSMVFTICCQLVSANYYPATVSFGFIASSRLRCTLLGKWPEDTSTSLELRLSKQPFNVRLGASKWLRPSAL